jgi:hypothetical protein
MTDIALFEAMYTVGRWRRWPSRTAGGSLGQAEATRRQHARSNLFAHDAAPSRGVASCAPADPSSRARIWIADRVSASLYGPGPESCSAR